MYLALQYKKGTLRASPPFCPHGAEDTGVVGVRAQCAQWTERGLKESGVWGFVWETWVEQDVLYIGLGSNTIDLIWIASAS